MDTDQPQTSDATGFSLTDPKITVRVIGLRKSYGNHTVLDNLDLEVRSGQCVVILGRSGSGKSVFLDCLLGFSATDAGSITLHDVTSDSESSISDHNCLDRFAVLFQNEGLVNWLTVEENIGLACRTPYFRTTCERARKLMCDVGLAPETVGDQKPTALSGGMRKQVALARGLAREPLVFILDEPTSGLDPFTSRKVIDTLNKKVFGQITAIVITHDYNLAAEVGEAIYYLHRTSGQLQLIETGSATGTDRVKIINSFIAGCDDTGQRGADPINDRFEWTVLIEPFRWIGSAAWSLRYLPSAVRYFSQLQRYFVELILKSSPLLAVVAVIIGIVLALQARSSLSMLGFENLMPGVVTASLLNSIVPILAGILLAGRVGSSIAAETSAMNKSNQIKALHLAGVNPHRFIMSPIALTMIISVPLLVLFTVATALIGIGVYIAYFAGSGDISSLYFRSESLETIRAYSIISAIVKGALFGAVIGTLPYTIAISDWARKKEIGQITTTAVVWTSFWVIVVDALVNVVFLHFKVVSNLI